MRPLTVTAFSSLASIGLATAARSYALQIDLSQVISPTMFTNLILVSLFTLATLICLWIALSYLTLAYAQRTTRQQSPLINILSRFATPRVRRTLAGGAIALSLVIPQPAYAEGYEGSENEELSDISWGSPDLLEITTQNDNYDQALVLTSPTASPIARSTETRSETQPSPEPKTNPLTSTSTNTVTDVDDTPYTRELLQHSQSPPPSPAPSSSPPASYTVKSGDTLWAIAKAHLPPNATDSDTAQACLLWAQANPQLTNPNLIYPGQLLIIPQENPS